MNDIAEFRHFRYLLAVAEHRGFRAAAEALNTSQPSLSRQARKFEKAFEIELFQKTRSGRIRLTPTGNAFIAIARDLLEARDEAIAALISIHRNELSTFRLGCSSFIDGDLCQVVCKLHTQLAPACAIRPSIGERARLLDDVLSDRLDAAPVTLPSLTIACESKTLSTIDSQSVCRHTIRLHRKQLYRQQTLRRT